ncbi:site-specific integrase [Chengkuizengella marina]|uniref:Site-specific integrase n=1 Tax=Chengkuizengella marina TaxID=2507566 RepID=A0A6N9Q1V2_9BACL|nr:site-specific integrase [Chengkuizengella marina]NBI28310.1 site-specific integrase [Chengkuizengella marina]
MKGSYRKRGCKCDKKKKCTCRATWSFSVSPGKDPDGKRRQITRSGFKTKREAEKACAALITEYEQGEMVEKEITLNEFMDLWIKAREGRVKSVTYARDSSHTRLHIKPFLGRKQLSKIKALHIEHFFKHLSLEKDLSNRTILDIHTVLKTALKTATKWGYLSKNVASLVDRPKVDKKEILIWDNSETQVFLKNAEETSRYYMAFLLALTTGMRQGEILGLRWKDVDLENNYISVRQTLTHDGKNFNTQTKTSAGNRLISIDKNTSKKLENYKKNFLNTERLKAGPLYKDMDLVIPSNIGTPVNPRNLLRSMASIIKKSNVPRISFHDLRHTHASLLLKQDVHPKIVSERLGHANIRITLDTYSHILPNMQKDTAEQFGKSFYSMSSNTL